MENKGNAIVGRKKKTEFDFYETPKWATEKAVEAMLMDGILNKHESIYEPCCGAGAISDILEIYGFENLKKSDIQTAECIKGEKGIDVYDVKDKVCEVVFTNPPYDRMTKDNMLNEFLRTSSKKVILLLNIFSYQAKTGKRCLKIVA